MDITGIANTELDDIPLGNVAGLVQTTYGPVIAELNNYALYGKGDSIQSCIQIEAWGANVNNKSKSFPDGKQSIETLDGYIIPLTIQGGLAYMPMRQPTSYGSNDIN